MKEVTEWDNNPREMWVWDNNRNNAMRRNRAFTTPYDQQGTRAMARGET